MAGRLQQLIQNGRNGSAVLFCGAGFTADCLNFEEEPTLGVTYHLLNLINAELKKAGKPAGFRDIKNAARQYKSDIGNYALMKLLKERFHINKVSSSIETILEYPWSSIYTTNYDNGIEVAMQGIQKRHTSLNNLDEPREPTASELQIVHLHGFAEAWTSDNFERSCILDADSYRHLTGVSNWLERLRFDIERAEVVIFLGFSAADFHLSQVFFNTTGLKKKAFFINRPTPSPDMDERATQEEFGEVLYIGREELADEISQILKQDPPSDPHLTSFTRFVLPDTSQSVPPVAAIEELFVWGKVDSTHIKRDLDVNKSDYHVLRSETARITEHLEKPGAIAFIHGDICDGKSLSILGAKIRIAAGRPVFQLTNFYTDILNDVSSILAAYPNAVLVIEGCFTLREDRLKALTLLVSASQGGLILSSRSIATEAESTKFHDLKSIPSLMDIRLGKIHEQEVGHLVALIDQIAGWREFHALTASDRRIFVEKECGGILPAVLLRLLKSPYVRDVYRLEYNKLSHVDQQDKRMLIAALLIAGIGHNAPTSFLSDIFEKDCESTIKNIASQSNGLLIARVDGDFVSTIPSIGARNFVENVVDDQEIVNTTIFVLRKLQSKYGRSEFENYIFKQLMRYSILSSVVSDKDEIDRFFDNISKVEYFRQLPLFWLQWHMAMSVQLRWNKAEDYLTMGYTAADAFEKRRGDKYNRKQLNDRKAKFLAARALQTERAPGDLFRDMKEALDIVDRLMRDAELTHHPYETLMQIAQVVEAKRTNVSTDLAKILVDRLKEIIGRAKARVEVVPEGYQRGHAETALKETESLAGDLR